MPSRSIIRTGVGPHREPRNRFPAMAAAINLLAARAARVQSRRNLSRSLSPKLDHSHSITRFDRSRTGPKPRTVTAPNPARASAFRREIASGLAISLMSSTSKSATNVTEPDQPRAGVREPADGEAPSTALPPNERITNALGNDLIERDIQVKDCEQRNKGIPAASGGVFRKRANEWFLWSFWYSQDLRRKRRTTAFS